MQIVETEHHIIFTEAWDKPLYACQDPCKRVWWRRDHKEAKTPEMLICECKGQLKKAIEGKDYKVLSNEQGNNKLSNGTVVGYCSWIKTTSQAKALKDWVNKLPKTSIEIRK